jgi:ethanolamine utilization protein EutQ
MSAGRRLSLSPLAGGAEHHHTAPRRPNKISEPDFFLSKNAARFFTQIEIGKRHKNSNQEEALVAQVVHFKKSERVFEAYGDDPKKATISRLVGPELSGTMGAGIARFDNCSIEWTVLYDELIVTLEGKFRLRVGDEVFETEPGDVLWVPKGTALAYEGEGATVFYALHPVDWRTREIGG